MDSDKAATYQVEPSAPVNTDLVLIEGYVHLDGTGEPTTEGRVPTDFEAAQAEWDAVPTITPDTTPNGYVHLDGTGEPTTEGCVRTDFETAQAEWDAVPTITATQTDNTPDTTPNAHIPQGDASRMVSHIELLTLYEKCPQRAEHKKHICPTVERTGLRSCCNFLFRPSTVHEPFQESRDLIFCAALWKFDNDEPAHLCALQTIYKKLMGNQLDVPRYGGHWDDIGFQGSDPATDLRGGGCLSLINLLFLFSEPPLSQLAHAIHGLSRDEHQNFPFAVMGITMTRIALQTLRSGLLNSEINKQKSVSKVFNMFYTAVFMHMFERWRDGGKTIADAGYVLAETEEYCQNNVSKVLKHLELHLTELAGENNSRCSKSGQVTSGFTTFEEIHQICG